MKIKDFVSQTFKEIQEAVEKVNADAGIKRGVYYPSDPIEFDIAVTATSISGSEGGASLEVFTLAKAGGKMTEEISDTQVSRVTFKLRISDHAKDTFPKVGTGRR